MADNTAIQNFKNEWLGRRVDYDHVYSYQCVDLILEYLKEDYGLASGVWGNAIDYWRSPTPALLTRFQRVSGTDALAGDIVVLNGLPGNPYGHIGIAYAEDSSTITILEQNGATGGGSGTGGDAIRLRAISKSRVAGLLRQIGASPAPSGSGTAKVTHEAYVRVAPTTSAALGGSKVLEPGDTFAYTSKVAGQSVGGNNIWYHSSLGHYVWSGNATG